jgi:hypothetical protein
MLRRKTPADRRHQQHRQRRRKQRHAREFNAHAKPGIQEQRQVHQHAPIAELDGGQQRADPCHGRRCEYAGIEQRMRASPLAPTKKDRPRHAYHQAGGSRNQGGVVPQERVDRKTKRRREQYDADGVQRTPPRISGLGDEPRHGQSQCSAEGDIGQEDPAPPEP